MFATRAFSWTNYLLAASYEMTDKKKVVVDEKTGEILCVAAWEMPKMTVMFALRGLSCLFYTY